jgi:hypothetical protein
MKETSFAEHNPLARLTAAALAIGGILGAAFVVISRGELIGALAMLSPRWMIAHNLHFASAALLLFGVVGLYLSHSHRLTLGGHFAFVLALLGTGFYFASGVVTAAVLPVIAAGSPGVVSAGGPLFSPPLPALIVSVAVFQLGWVALGMVIANAGLLPRWAGFATAAGAAIGLVPTHPFGPAPWIVTDVAWIIFAIGLAGLGLAGWRRDLRSTPTLRISTEGLAP